MSYCQFGLLFCLLFVSFAHAENPIDFNDYLEKTKELVNNAGNNIKDINIKDTYNQFKDHVNDHLGTNSSATLNVSFLTAIMALLHAYF